MVQAQARRPLSFVDGIGVGIAGMAAVARRIDQTRLTKTFLATARHGGIGGSATSCIAAHAFATWPRHQSNHGRVICRRPRGNQTPA
jgi:hypothetical protein